MVYKSYQLISEKSYSKYVVSYITVLIDNYFIYIKLKILTYIPFLSFVPAIYRLNTVYP